MAVGIVEELELYIREVVDQDILDKAMEIITELNHELQDYRPQVALIMSAINVSR